MRKTACLLVLVAGRAGAEPPQAVWLTFARNEPTHVTVNWATARPEASVVWHGTGGVCDARAEAAGTSTLHHVEVPLPVSGELSYRIGAAGGGAEVFRTRGWGAEELRVAMVADWGFAGADLSALLRDDVNLLVTGGDHVPGLHAAGVVGDAAKTNVAAHLRLLRAYPELFRRTPVMPVLGNHDREVRPRGDAAALGVPVYDVEATAYRALFPQPDLGWCWRFDLPQFGLRLVGLDLNHVQDQGTLLQTCHACGEGSEQLGWYRGVMESAGPPLVLTLNNEKSSVVRGLAGGAWGRLMRKGTLTATGFGYFAERAEADGTVWLNTSLNGKGAVYRDPASAFLASENSYLLFRVSRGGGRVRAEIKRLSDGAVLDVCERPGRP